jgi:hypothetical protein
MLSCRNDCAHVLSCHNYHAHVLSWYNHHARVLIWHNDRARVLSCRNGRRYEASRIIKAGFADAAHASVGVLAGLDEGTLLLYLPILFCRWNPDRYNKFQ